MAAKRNKKSADHYILQRIKAFPWRVIGVVTLVVLLLNVVVGTISSYNQMVQLRTAADTQWQQVEVQYQRRFDLIPNLVATAKGAQIQEKNVFIQIAVARSR